jgi:hypothetical protein
MIQTTRQAVAGKAIGRQRMPYFIFGSKNILKMLINRD